MAKAKRTDSRQQAKAQPHRPGTTRRALPRSQADLARIKTELLAEHQHVERLYDLFDPPTPAHESPAEQLTSNPTLQTAAIESLLLRTRSLLDFYWGDLVSPARATAFQRMDGFAGDLLAPGQPWRDGHAAWRSARAIAEPLLADWHADGKKRMNVEVAHLSYRRLRQPARPKGDRLWQPQYLWVLSSISARLLADALAPNIDLGFAQSLRALLRPFMQLDRVDAVVARVQEMRQHGAFTRDFS